MKRQGPRHRVPGLDATVLIENASAISILGAIGNEAQDAYQKTVRPAPCLRTFPKESMCCASSQWTSRSRVIDDCHSFRLTGAASVCKWESTAVEGRLILAASRTKRTWDRTARQERWRTLRCRNRYVRVGYPGPSAHDFQMYRMKGHPPVDSDVSGEAYMSLERVIAENHSVSAVLTATWAHVLYPAQLVRLTHTFVHPQVEDVAYWSVDGTIP